jgi:endoglucanase
MKFTNIVLAASAAGMAVAYPSGRDVVPNKRSVEKKRATGFTCESLAQWTGIDILHTCK